MSSLGTVRDRLGEVLEPEQANVLAEVITESYSDLVKTGDLMNLNQSLKTLLQLKNVLSKELKNWLKLKNVLSKV